MVFLTQMPSAQTYMSTLSTFLPIILLIVVFYFFLIRPQKKRDKAEKEMRNSIQVGDEISTIGGFIGKVVSIFVRPDQTQAVSLGDPRKGKRSGGRSGRGQEKVTLPGGVFYCPVLPNKLKA